MRSRRLMLWMPWLLSAVLVSLLPRRSGFSAGEDPRCAEASGTAGPTSEGPRWSSGVDGPLVPATVPAATFNRAAGGAESLDLGGLESTNEPGEPHEVSADLPTLIAGLRGAVSAEEKGRWADRLAAHGGRTAVEELFLACFEASEPEIAAAIRESFKVLTAEEDLRLLATAFTVTTDFDVLEAVIETVARGATPAIVNYLASLQLNPELEPSQRYAARWAIERIRNPEAARALAKLEHWDGLPALAEAGRIARAAMVVEGWIDAPFPSDLTEVAAP